MDPVTQIALDWANRCFGRKHVSSIGIRSLRLAEEAVELAQAADVPKDTMLRLVETVYSRPKGDAYRELGAVVMTTTVLSAGCFNQDPREPFLVELLRVLAKSPADFAKRNQEKLDLGLGADT